jgi:hypothetical protein
LRQAKNGQNWLHIPHFYAVKREFAKEQFDLRIFDPWVEKISDTQRSIDSRTAAAASGP